MLWDIWSHQSPSSALHISASSCFLLCGSQRCHGWLQFIHVFVPLFDVSHKFPARQCFPWCFQVFDNMCIFCVFCFVPWVQASCEYSTWVLGVICHVAVCIGVCWCICFVLVWLLNLLSSEKSKFLALWWCEVVSLWKSTCVSTAIGSGCCAYTISLPLWCEGVREVLHILPLVNPVWRSCPLPHCLSGPFPLLALPGVCVLVGTVFLNSKFLLSQNLT